MRELATALDLDDKTMEVDVPKDLVRASPAPADKEGHSRMTEHHDYVSLRWLLLPHCLPNTRRIRRTCREARHQQAHVAETEKYAHGTFFFNGGFEKQLENEERHMIPDSLAEGANVRRKGLEKL